MSPPKVHVSLLTSSTVLLQTAVCYKLVVTTRRYFYYPPALSSGVANCLISFRSFVIRLFVCLLLCFLSAHKKSGLAVRLLNLLSPPAPQMRYRGLHRQVQHPQFSGTWVRPVCRNQPSRCNSRLVLLFARDKSADAF